MTAATVRAPHDGAGTSPDADAPMAGDLEVPRPLRLVLTAGWNLTESVGLPVAAYAVAAYAVAAWAGGRDAGMVAGLVAIWLTAVIRKVAAFFLGTRTLESMREFGILPDFAGVVVSDRYHTGRDRSLSLTARRVNAYVQMAGPARQFAVTDRGGRKKIPWSLALC